MLNVGQLGKLGTIAGERLRGSSVGVSHATLAGVEAELLAESDTEVTVEVNSGDDKTGDVVLTASTKATVALVDGSHTPLLELLTPRIYVSTNPSAGQFRTRTEIAGSNLRSAGSNVVSVTLTGTEVKSIDDESARVNIKGSGLLSGDVALDSITLAGTAAVEVSATDKLVAVTTQASGQTADGGVVRLPESVSPSGLTVRTTSPAASLAITSESNTEIAVVIGLF